MMGNLMGNGEEMGN